MPQRLKPAMLCENSRAATDRLRAAVARDALRRRSHVAVKSAVCENALPFFVVPVQLPVRCFVTTAPLLRVDDDALAADRGAVRLEAVRLVRDRERAVRELVRRRDRAVEVHEAVGAGAALEDVRRDVARERGRDAARGLEPLAGVRLHLRERRSVVGAVRRACPGSVGSAPLSGSSTPDSMAVVLILEPRCCRRRAALRRYRACRRSVPVLLVFDSRSRPPRDHRGPPSSRPERRSRASSRFPPFGYDGDGWSTPCRRSALSALRNSPFSGPFAGLEKGTLLSAGERADVHPPTSGASAARSFSPWPMWKNLRSSPCSSPKRARVT